MMINEIMANRNMSKYRLSKNSGIPYTTLTDILSGKAQLVCHRLKKLGDIDFIIDTLEENKIREYYN